jgi:hypothetical protein
MLSQQKRPSLNGMGYGFIGTYFGYGFKANSKEGSDVGEICNDGGRHTHVHPAFPQLLVKRWGFDDDRGDTSHYFVSFFRLWKGGGYWQNHTPTLLPADMMIVEAQYRELVTTTPSLVQNAMDMLGLEACEGSLTPSWESVICVGPY